MKLVYNYSIICFFTEFGHKKRIEHLPDPFVYNLFTNTIPLLF
jgi:hypothetical protein